MFNIKSYQKAENIKDAIGLLQNNPDAKLIAGGTDILIKLHKGKGGFHHLVDIHDLEELSFITMSKEKDIVIGPGTTFTQVATSPLVLEHIPVLSEAVLNIGGPQVRNMATIGGNICNGVPSADSATSLLSLNAVLTIEGPSGTRQMPIEKFFLSPGKVALDPYEILTAITVTHDNYAEYSGHFYKYAMRLAMDIATIGCAAVCKLENGLMRDLRISYGVAAPVPIRCHQAEDLAEGQPIDNQLLEKIANAVVAEVSPRSSWRASKELRLQIIKTLAKRVTKQVIINAGGKLT